MAGLALFLAASTAPLANPLAAVNADWSLCTRPDDENRSCSVMTTFTLLPDGQYRTVSRSIVQGLPGLVLVIPSTTYVRGEKVCGKARRADLEQAVVERHVEGVTPQQERAALQSMRFMFPIDGAELCSAFEPDGVHFSLRTWVNGKLEPAVDSRVRWVHKDDGYNVVGWHGARSTPLR